MEREKKYTVKNDVLETKLFDDSWKEGIIMESNIDVEVRSCLF